MSKQTAVFIDGGDGKPIFEKKRMDSMLAAKQRIDRVAILTHLLRPT